MNRAVTSVALAVLLTACAPRHDSLGAPAAQAHAELRTLIVMLDGVPHGIVDSLWQAGHFRSFARPSRVVSSFPSLTGVAFGEVWHEQPAGYEDRYFDTAGNRIRGGVMDHVARPDADEGYQRQIDIRANGLAASLTYVLPGPFAALELRALRSALLERMRSDSVLVAYVVSTDALAHRAGREAVVSAVLQLEATIQDVQRRAPDARIALFSDHGNDLVPSRRVPLEASLRSAGLEPSRRLQSGTDVVLPQFGLVGSAFLYAMPEAEPLIARALAPVEGVGLVLFQDPEGSIHVLGHGGEARIERRGTLLRYVAERGDPLGLRNAAASMRADGRADADGFAADSIWFDASLATAYIDSMRRILGAFGPAVGNPASVIVSFDAGYHYGAPAADFLVDVTGTHGSLLTTSSLAFFMSTERGAPPLIRGSDLQRFLPPLSGAPAASSLVEARSGL